MSHPLPGTPFPLPDVPMIGGGRLGADHLTAPLTVLNVYRGLHCPRCRRQMEDFVAQRAALEGAGVGVISISTDPMDRAEGALSEWAIAGMPIGYDLSLDQARAMGCYISSSIREGETALFAEAALFFLKQDGTLWGSVVNTFPFARPDAAQVLDIATVVSERGYPPRGTVAA